MKGFFKVLSVEEFFELLREFPVLDSEEVPLDQAYGRTLAEDVISPEDLPLTDRSCMDGYAVRAEDLFGAGESNPAYLECAAELPIQVDPDYVLAPGECAAIVTGGCLPRGANAVIMVEYTECMGDAETLPRTIEFRKSAAPGENVMRQGEDARAGKRACAAGTWLRGQEIGLLAALGVGRVRVFRQARVGIISTGDELVPVEAKVRPGLVRDVNSHALECLVRQAGGAPVRYGLVRDKEDELLAMLEKGLEENDILLLSGGSSVGVRDLTMSALEAMAGVEILAHGVAVSPGKPQILARRGSKAVWGLPGQVASAQVVMQVFGVPLLRRLMGDSKALDDPMPVKMKAGLARNLASKQGREDFVRVRLKRTAEGEILAEPVLGKSGLLRTMVESDGLVRIPAGEEGFDAGREVEVLLFEGFGFR